MTKYSEALVVKLINMLPEIEQGDVDVSEFDEILFKIYKENDSEVIPRLLLGIRDDYDFPELMMGIIKTCEGFGPEKYVSKLFDILIELALQSPYWAGLAIIRVYNDLEMRQEMTNICSNSKVYFDTVIYVVDQLSSKEHLEIEEKEAIVKLLS